MLFMVFSLSVFVSGIYILTRHTCGGVVGDYFSFVFAEWVPAVWATLLQPFSKQQTHFTMEYGQARAVLITRSDSVSHRSLSEELPGMRGLYKASCMWPCGQVITQACDDADGDIYTNCASARGIVFLRRSDLCSFKKSE